MFINLASVLRYQNWLIIFFRTTKLHRALGSLWSFIVRCSYSKNASLDGEKIGNVNFSSIKKYHQNNYLDDNAVWYLNRVCHGKDLHIGVKNRDDYTKELVFSYLEWIFSVDNSFDKHLLVDVITNSLRSRFSNEPSSVSLRIYPLIYAYKKGLLDRDFLSQNLFSCFESLQKKVELDVGANHLIDNFISASILSLLFHRYRIARIYIFLLRASLAHSTSSGFYEERNPTYAVGLSIRLQILIDIIDSVGVDRAKFVSSAFKLRCFKERLLVNPSAQINDSYLPFSVIYKKDEGINTEAEHYCPDYFFKKRFGNLEASLILNSIGRRGYNAHAHDASMSLFVFDSTLEKFVICGYGTACYAACQERSFSRSSDQYPTVSSEFKRTIVGLGSFRLGRIFRPEIKEIKKNKFQDERLKLSYQFDDGIKISSQNIRSKFHFYSDFDDLDKINGKCSISFRGESKIIKRKTQRYDGIYNVIDSYHYEISFDDDLVISFENN